MQHLIKQEPHQYLHEFDVGQLEYFYYFEDSSAQLFLGQNSDTELMERGRLRKIHKPLKSYLQEQIEIKQMSVREKRGKTLEKTRQQGKNQSRNQEMKKTIAERRIDIENKKHQLQNINKNINQKNINIQQKKIEEESQLLEEVRKKKYREMYYCFQNVKNNIKSHKDLNKEEDHHEQKQFQASEASEFQYLKSPEQLQFQQKIRQLQQEEERTNQQNKEIDQRNQFLNNQYQQMIREFMKLNQEYANCMMRIKQQRAYQQKLSNREVQLNRKKEKLQKKRKQIEKMSILHTQMIKFNSYFVEKIDERIPLELQISNERLREQ